MKSNSDNVTRRSLLRRISTTAAGLLAFATLPPGSVLASPEGSEKSPAGKKLPKWGMAIDLDLCTGCGGCAAACKSENNVPPAGPEPEKRGTEISWMTLINKETVEAHASFPDFFPAPCMHCEDPACVKVCPVGATYKTEEGIVAQIWDRCIGCRYCQNACPYSRRSYNWSAPEWPESYKSFLNPDVATRPEGVVEKCTFCNHRLRKAKETARREERQLEDKDVQKLPACAETCPANAIVFGDLNDPESVVSKQSRDPRATVLLEHLGTHPKVFYLGKQRRIGS